MVHLSTTPRALPDCESGELAACAWLPLEQDRFGTPAEAADDHQWAPEDGDLVATGIAEGAIQPSLYLSVEAQGRARPLCAVDRLKPGTQP